MRPGRLGLIAAALAAMFVGALGLSLPTAAAAQPRAAAPAPLPPITPAARQAGMTAAPAIIAATHTPCTLADARLIGSNGRGAELTNFYELVCTGQLGFVAAVKPAAAGDLPQVETCLQHVALLANGQFDTLHCRLPGNVDQNALLQNYVQHAGIGCTVASTRSIGQTPAPANLVLEVTCTQGTGYIMFIAVPPTLDGTFQMLTCLHYQPEQNIHCTMTDRAAQLAAIDTLSQTSDKACPVRDRRYVMTTRSNTIWYEIACQAENTGYMMEVGADGRVKSTLACVDADVVDNGCHFTNTRQARTEQNALYSTLANRSGFNCQVEQYAALRGPRGQDVQELKCSNRSDGAIGIFPAGAPAVIIPCARAEISGYLCSLTQPSASFPTLTAEMRALDPPIQSCTVAATHYVGNTPDGKSYLEVSCSDGLLGYFLEYVREPTPHLMRAIVCTQAANIGTGCTLPANVAARRQPATATPGAPATH